MKKLALALAKVGLGLGIVAYLVYANRAGLRDLAGQSPSWAGMLLALVVCAAAVVITFVRWYWLVVAQDLPFRPSDAIRLGFIGYFFSLVVPGSVGGDLVKAAFLAREQKRRTVAVATVVLDRIVGLLALFLLATTATLLFWSQIAGEPKLRSVAFFVWGVTGVSLVGLAILFSPMFHSGPWVRWATELKWFGGPLGEVLGAVAVYRRRIGVVVAAVLVSLVSHSGFVLTYYVASRSLGGWTPAVERHFMTIPLGMFAGAVPLTPGGVGIAETFIQELYALLAPLDVGVDVSAARSKGLAASLAYRAITIAVALIGLGYYLAARRQVRELIHEAEALETRDPSTEVIGAASDP